AYKGEHRQALQRMLDDAHRGEFAVLVVWAADRLCRQGIEELLRLIRELRERNVSLVSHQEPWLNGSDATTELLAAVAAWVATQESVRRSERIRAGLARRRAQGKPMGGAAFQAKQRQAPAPHRGLQAGMVATQSSPIADAAFA
ncbi:MAG TPA: recombinase family protein, partial [Steroidobacteraceae bacterium]|nr:recombinase family protein [Steroidobacteraceae bacterium]